jgi:hypothetical protein
MSTLELRAHAYTVGQAFLRASTAPDMFACCGLGSIHTHVTESVTTSTLLRGGLEQCSNIEETLYKGTRTYIAAFLSFGGFIRLRNHGLGVPSPCFEARGGARHASTITRVPGRESSRTLDGGGGAIVCTVDNGDPFTVLC